MRKTMKTMVELNSPYLFFDLPCLILSPLVKNPLDFMIYEASALWIFCRLLHLPLLSDF